MIKKTITYTDFNDEERTEEFIFNLSKTEWQEFSLSRIEGLDQYILKITSSRDGKKIIDLFKELVSRAYGIKSDDGRRLMKSPEISREFFETNAWDVMFQEFIENPTDTMVAFLNGIAPKDVELTKEMVEQQTQSNPILRSVANAETNKN